MTEVSCRIYKSALRADTYLFVPADDDLSRVPEALLAHFGPPSLVMSLDLWSGRPLARADADTVLSQLRERGYYLQMPPGSDEPAPTPN